MPPAIFIRPALPTQRQKPPVGEDWLHEIKFDGWRVQIQKSDRGVVIHSKNGIDITTRCHGIAGAVAALSVASVILDGELVAIGRDGRQDFAVIGRPGYAHQAWCFDVLERDGTSLLTLPLSARRLHLASVLEEAPESLQVSQTFDDPLTLFAAAGDKGLEGIVSKQSTSLYRSGTRCGWIKVKSRAWREATRERLRKAQKT